jgi:hypothetical protein
MIIYYSELIRGWLILNHILILQVSTGQYNDMTQVKSYHPQNGLAEGFV